MDKEFWLITFVKQNPYVSVRYETIVVNSKPIDWLIDFKLKGGKNLYILYTEKLTEEQYNLLSDVY